MKNLFDIEGGVFSFMDKAADLVLLNILWLLCCLPVFTIGASTTAMYYVILKMVQGRDYRLYKDFFHSFRQNFKQATVITLIFLLIFVLFFMDNRIVWNFGKAAGYLLYTAFMAAILVLLYVFPVLSFFDDRTGIIMRTAFLMSIRHFPKTILILILNLTFPVTAAVMYDATSIFLYLWVVMGGALAAWASSHIFLDIFKLYIPKGYEKDFESENQDII